MQPYKNVYSLSCGRLVKNTENKIEYTKENGEKRVKTNPGYNDLLKVGKYRLKEDKISEKTTQGETFYRVDGDCIVAKIKEAD